MVPDTEHPLFRLSSRFFDAVFGSDDARCSTIRMPRSTFDSSICVSLILRDFSLSFVKTFLFEKKPGVSNESKAASEQSSYPIVVGSRGTIHRDSLDRAGFALFYHISRVLDVWVKKATRKSGTWGKRRKREVGTDRLEIIDNIRS